MTEIKRYEIHEDWAQSGIVAAGDWAFTSYCVGSMEADIAGQINGAFDYLAEKLAYCDLSLKNVVKITALFGDIQETPTLEKVIKERFGGNYPAQISLQTEFCEAAQLFQMDAIAYRG